MSQTSSLSPSRLALQTISPLFVDRVGRPLWFYHLELDKNAISAGKGVKRPVSVFFLKFK